MLRTGRLVSLVRRLRLCRGQNSGLLRCFQSLLRCFDLQLYLCPVLCLLLLLQKCLRLLVSALGFLSGLLRGFPGLLRRFLPFPGLPGPLRRFRFLPSLFSFLSGLFRRRLRVSRLVKVVQGLLAFVVPAREPGAGTVEVVLIVLRLVIGQLARIGRGALVPVPETSPAVGRITLAGFVEVRGAALPMPALKQAMPAVGGIGVQQPLQVVFVGVGDDEVQHEVLR